MFRRKPKNQSSEIPIPKTNTANQHPAWDNSDQVGSKKSGWTDKVRPPMPYSIQQQAYDVRNATHRKIQCEENPFLYKLTFGLAKKLLSKQPYPFSYAKPYQVDLNSETQTAPVSGSTGLVDSDPLAKSNSAAQADSIFRGATPLSSQGSLGTLGMFGNKTAPAPQTSEIQYELRADLNYLYQLWLNDGMFRIMRRALAIAFQQCVCIVATQQGYYIFERKHIEKVITKDRKPYQVEIKWPAQGSDVEELKKGKLESANITYTIGKDCILYTPLPCVESPFGVPFILPMWSAGVAKDFGRFMHTIYLWKGGIRNQYNRYPSTLPQTSKDSIEMTSRMGMLSEGTNIECPPGISPEYMDKAFTHEEVAANDINWEEYNSILSQDTMFPKSFIEGQVESGALGGSAPEQDMTKEKEEIADLFVFVDELTKLINSTFYKVADTNYIVVPWQESKMQSQPDSKAEMTPPEDTNDETLPEKPIQKTDETVKVQIQRKSNYIAKKNSVADGIVEYDAVLLPVGKWPYGDHEEEVDFETVSEYFNDPLSVKEGYFHIEHPDNPAEVNRDDAVGKYKITGVDERGLLGKIYSNTDLGDEVGLSNFYFSHDDKTGALVKHRRIDFRNVVSTTSPRMNKAKAKKRT
jgi:hypothetical protein